MSWLYFIVMQLITRAVSVVTTAFSLNGDIIPYDTLWGIIVWICIGIAIIALFILIWKKGEQFEKWFFSLFRSKKGKGLSLSASVDAAETADKNGKEKGNAPAADQSDSPSGETENNAVGRVPPEKGCGAPTRRRAMPHLRPKAKTIGRRIPEKDNKKSRKRSGSFFYYSFQKIFKKFI